MVLRMDKQYIDRHEAYTLIRNEAGTHELPASKEAYERAARIVAQMHPVNIAIFAEKTNFCPYCGAKMEVSNKNDD